MGRAECDKVQGGVEELRSGFIRVHVTWQPTNWRWTCGGRRGGGSGGLCWGRSEEEKRLVVVVCERWRSGLLGEVGGA